MKHRKWNPDNLDNTDAERALWPGVKDLIIFALVCFMLGKVVMVAARMIL